MNQTLRIPRPSGVLSLDRDGFDGACAALMERALEDGTPDALIGIRTGGLYVAEAMARSQQGRIPVLSITCRRPTSSYKPGAGVLKSLVSSLPRPVVDKLRVWEHAMLTSRSRPAPSGGHRFDPEELEQLDRCLSEAGPSPSLLIVDDAVDTGATLFRVKEAVLGRAPPSARIRSAVITVTTPDPMAAPDLALYRGQLCRFPWSLDA